MSTRRTAAGLLAGGLALSLVAAGTTAAASPVGTATTRLLGAELTVTGLGDLPSVELLDVLTSATTDGTPLATTSIVPIRAGDQVVGASGASSDGASSDAGSLASFGDLLGPLGLTVSPVSSTATATATSAVATVEAATAQLGALLGALGLDLDVAGITSLVDQDGAIADQGLAVSGLDLGLGDLGLGADVLGQLPLDDLLALLDGLPLDLPAGADELVDQLLASAGDVEGALDLLGASGAPLDASIADLGLLDGVLGDVTGLDGLLDQVLGLGAGDPLDAVTALLGGLGSALTDAGCPLGAVPVLGNVLGLLGGAETCLEGELSAIDDTLATGGLAGFGDLAPGDLLAAVQSALDDLTSVLPDQLAALLDQLGVLGGLVDSLAGLLGQLDGLLALLPDLLGDAAGLDLLSVGAFDVGTTAVAGPTTAASTASVLCEPVAVAVLGESVDTPDCADSLAGLGDVTAVLDDALGTLTGVLNTLPLDGLLQVGDLRLDVFSNLVEEVTEVDGVVTATAGFDLLDLELPTLTLDPAAVTDPLADLGLPVDALDTVTGLLEGLEADLGPLDGLPGVDDLLTTLDGVLAGLDDPTGLGTTLGAVLDALGALDLGDLGSLSEVVTTPGLALRIDPAATATFMAAAGGGTPTPAPSPSPAPAPAPAPTPTPAPGPTPTTPGAPTTPSLPSTGGGLAALGVAALAGAFGLRRRDRVG